MNIFNFSAGPTMIPLSVMERVQKEFTNYNSMGIGITELSHRTIEFSGIIDRTEANIRKLMEISDDYAICFVQGGASMQFAMLPMNLMNPGGFAEYMDTGYWSEKAIVEAEKIGEVKIVASSKDALYSRIPNFRKWKPAPDASYVHITTNNTIEGTQYHSYPEIDNGVPLVADMSTDIMTKNIEVNLFDLIYASTQKVLGPTGLSIVIIKRNLADRAEKKNLPTMLDYTTYIYEKSMHNTPPTFSIYLLMLVTEWLLDQGGIEVMDKINTVKSEVIYECLDSSSFYNNFIESPHRSRVSIVFRLPTKELDEMFIDKAEKRGLIGLRGHRSVGGIRASMYNSMPLEGVEALVDFMYDFEKKHG